VNSHYSEETVQTQLSLKQLFLGLWPYIKKHKSIAIFSLVLTLVHILVARLLPLSIAYAIDHGVTQKNQQTFITAAIVYSILQIIFTFSEFLYAYGYARLGNRVLYDLKNDLLCHIQKLPMSFFNKNPIGRLVNRITYDPNSLQDVFSEGLITVFIQFISLLSVIASMLFVSWKLTLISLITLPLFIYWALQVTQKMRYFQRASKKEMGLLSAFVTERLQGVKTLQLLGAVDLTNQAFAEHSNSYKTQSLNVIQAGARLHPVINMATAFILSSLIMASGAFTQEQGLSLGALTALILYTQDFIPPLRTILERYQQFQNSMTSAERIFPLLKEPTEQELSIEPLKNNNPSYQSPHVASTITATAAATTHFNTSPSNAISGIAGNSSSFAQGEILIQNLSFQYGKDLPVVLEQINLTINAGEKIAFVGKTGSGKSTLISLLQRFYEPGEGLIMIDQRPISEIPLPQLRKCIGVIQQDPFVFRGTLRENFTLADTDMSDEIINDKLAQLGLAEYFDSKKMNLDFSIEEKGQNISLGERQLINFVRLFLVNPKVLVLDEATANLDSITESILDKALKELTKNRTTLIIAHRLSTLQGCHKHYLVSQTKISLTDIKVIENNPDLLV